MKMRLLTTSKPVPPIGRKRSQMHQISCKEYKLRFFKREIVRFEIDHDTTSRLEVLFK